MNDRSVNYYEVLGVSENATLDEIKGAYKISARQYHPDVNTAPNAQYLMTLLNAAHAILSEPNARAAYDRSRSTSSGAQWTDDVQEADPKNLEELIALFRRRGIEIADKRPSGGSLWVVESPGAEALMESATDLGLNFIFAPNGAKATQRRPGWYLRLTAED
jgi:curved DNA-binding protein CbpA